MNAMRRLNPNSDFFPDDVRYIVNTFGQEVIVVDINGRFPYEEGTVYMVSEKDFKESSDLKSCIRSGILVDITSQILASIANNKKEDKQLTETGDVEQESSTKIVSEELSIQPQQSSLPPPPSLDSPRVIKTRDGFMLSDIETSRALAGADREERLAALNNGTRPGARTGILISEYDSPEQEAMIERQRQSILIKEDNRANLPNSFDPRMTRGKTVNKTINVNGIQIQLPEEAVQKKNQSIANAINSSLENTQTNQRSLNNPFWWQNSSIATERMFNQIMESRNRQTINNNEDYRLQKPSATLTTNPILAQALSGALDMEHDRSQKDSLHKKNSATKNSGGLKKAKKQSLPNNPILADLGLSNVGENAISKIPQFSISDILNDDFDSMSGKKGAPSKKNVKKSTKSSKTEK